MKNLSERTVARASGIIMTAMLLSRLLGWARDALIAHTFGRNWQTDAYWAAFSVPDILYYLFAGGALSAAFIPVFTEFLAKKREREGWQVACTIANGMTLLICAGVILWWFIAPYLVRILAPGFLKEPRHVRAGTFALCVSLTRILCPMVIFTGLSALLTGILNSYQHFTAPAVAWCIYNLGIIAAALLALMYKNISHISWLCYGVLAGAAGMVIVQLPVLFRKGFRYSFKIDWQNEAVRRIVKLFVPAMIGLAIGYTVVMLIPQVFGSYISEAVTALRYANRLILLPLGLFGASIAVAVFPTLSRQAAQNQLEEFKDTLSLWTRTIFFLSIPSAVGLIVLSKPIIQLLWMSGQFGPSDAEATAYALFFYAFGLLGLSAIQILPRAFYSFKDTITPALIGIAVIGLNFLLCYIFITKTQLRHGGIALAVSLTATVQMTLLISFLRWKIGGLGIKKILSSFIRILGASLVMGAVCWALLLGARKALFLPLKACAAIEVLVILPVGIGTYLLMASLLRVEELGAVLEMVRRRNLRSE